MSKHQYSDKLHLSKDNEKKLITINDIIDEYKADGYVLTLRQLYYQLVSRDIIPNLDKEYKKVSSILVKGRMAGVVDWDAIEDRLRVPDLPYWVHDVPDAINDTIKSYRLNRQKGQDVYLEVVCEKDALSGVLKRVTHKYHLNLIVNRGYSSCTAMHDAYKRMIRAFSNEQTPIILYLGDHDPSGLDMIRDISNRLNEFGSTGFRVEHIALTTSQVKKHKPPPNPTKITDPRAKWYLKQYGQTCWEVDALDPKTLISLVEAKVKSLIDMDMYRDVLIQEQEDKRKLEEIRTNF